MPIVNGKHYSYTKAGYRAAARARKKKKPSKRRYSQEVIAMVSKNG